jgi:CBS domain-containing protein
MRAYQVMSYQVITTTPDTAIVDAANLMMEKHISGLPVVDKAGALVGIISQGDFLHRAEIGTQRKHSRWLQLFIGPGKRASDFVHEQGRRVEEIMTRNPRTVTEDAKLEEIVHLMEKGHFKRLPVMRNDRLVGIVTRSDLLHAVAGLARNIPDPTADDDHMRDEIIAAIKNSEWVPIRLGVTVQKGIVDLRGVLTIAGTDEALVVLAENVPGVRQVHNHFCWVDLESGTYFNPEEYGAAPPLLVK